MTLRQPRNHFELLENMEVIMLRLDVAQKYVNATRAMPTSDGHIQLLMDRKQAEIDETKQLIDQMYIDVPRSN